LPLNLRTGDPELRVDDSSPHELLDAASRLETWDDTTRYVADYLLNAWTLRACGSDDPKSIGELETVLDALLERLPNAGQLPESLRGRWEGYLSLLAGQLLRLPSEEDLQELLSRDQISSLLQSLPADGSYLAQGELRDTESYSASRLSQLLGEIADHGLISSRKHGRNKDWRLTERGQQMLAKQSHGQQPRLRRIATKSAPTSNSTPSPLRGMSAFRLHPQEKKAA
jgi:DNA-binding MarR family transcriptional regulator